MIEIIFKFLFGSEGGELYAAFLSELSHSSPVMETVVCVSIVFALFLVVCFYQFIRSIMGRKGR